MARAALIVVALLLAGCGEATGAGEEPDVAGTWELAEGTADGVALPQPPGAGATLEFGGEELRGTSFCNHYFSGYRLDGDVLTVDGLGGTDMGCAHDVMAAESAYLSALGAVA